MAWLEINRLMAGFQKLPGYPDIPIPQNMERKFKVTSSKFRAYHSDRRAIQGKTAFMKDPASAASTGIHLSHSHGFVGCRECRSRTIPFLFRCSRPLIHSNWQSHQTVGFDLGSHFIGTPYMESIRAPTACSTVLHRVMGTLAIVIYTLSLNLPSRTKGFLTFAMLLGGVLNFAQGFRIPQGFDMELIKISHLPAWQKR